jgi:RNA polymerase sigma-70 factor (ECF subfamily)
MKPKILTPPVIPATGPSDATALKAVAVGDLGALGLIYDRYARDVWRVLSRVMSDSDDVEDVVHATFLTLPDVAASFDGRPSCRNWICGIAVRLALRRRRSLRRFTRMLARFSEIAKAETTSDPESQAIHRQDLATFERTLASLPEKKRAVFVLVELQGLSQEEVSRVLEIPAATVRTRLFSARQILRAAIERHRGTT